MLKFSNNNELSKRLKQLCEKSVNIGIVGKSDSKLLTYAVANEYGANISITAKMRRKLKWLGIHVKDETTHIILPERSFIRSTFASKKYLSEFVKKTEKLLAGVIEGTKTPENLMDAIGLIYVNNIKNTIVTADYPELHPVTIERKGKGKKILFDSGRLFRAINYEVS